MPDPIRPIRCSSRRSSRCPTPRFSTPSRDARPASDARFGTLGRRLASSCFALGALLVLVAGARAQSNGPTTGGDRNLTILAPADGIERAGGPVADSFDTARPAVVHVFVEVEGRNTFKLERPSSGIVVDATGLVLTWFDLVAEGFEADDDEKTVHVQLPNGDRHPVALLARDRGTGLALLRVTDAEFLPSIAIRPDRARPGERVGVLGYHDGEKHVGFAGVASPSFGHVVLGEGPDANLVERDSVLLTDAAIQQRSHGAPLLDADGAMLGICNAQHVRDATGPDPSLEELKAPSYGVVIPSDRILALFPQHLARAPRADAPDSESATAYGRAADAVCALRRDGRTAPLGDDDPYAKQRRGGVGSAVVIDASGLALTNLHLVPPVGSGGVELTFRNGKSYEADVVERDHSTNTALLQIRDGRGFPAVAIGDPDDLRPGDHVFALGNPEGHTVGVTAGVLSARRLEQLQIDADIGNQNAGGPLIDGRGALVGLVDGGRVDRIDVAYRQRGDRTKVNSSLNLTPGLDAIRRAFGTEIPDRNDASLPAAARTDLRDTVDRIAGSMLNIFIERVVRTEAESDNPFAQPEERSFPVSLGSGVIIDPSGLALTNWHVVDSATFPDGSPRDDHVVRALQYDGQRFDVRVLSISREEDLALIQLELEPGQRLPAIELGASSLLEVGDRAFAIGNPEGNANTVTAGIVTALDEGIRVKGRWAKLENLIETDAAINGGNSGGALLDGAGRLIGINSAGGNAFNVTGYAIAVDHVRERLANVLLSPKKLRSVYLGITAEDVDGRVVAARVEPDSPASRAGLEPGDVIRAVDGLPIRWSVGFRTALIDRAPEPLPIAIERDGAEHTIEATPLDWTTRSIEKQIGVEVDMLEYGDDEQLVQAASIAFVRAVTGSDTAMPTEIPATLVRVARVSPPNTQYFAAPEDQRTIDAPPTPPLEDGDILLGVQWRRRIKGAIETNLITFEKPADAHETFQNTGDYGGAAVDTWIYRDGAVQKIELVVARLLP